MIPRIDPDVKYIGSSKLRDLSAIELRALTGAIVVTGAQNTPLAVILPYSTYLAMQESMELAIEGVARIVQDSDDGTLADNLASKAEPRGIRHKGDGKR